MRNTEQKNSKVLIFSIVIVLILFLNINPFTVRFFTLKNHFRDESPLSKMKTPRSSYTHTWKSNGTALCTANNRQDFNSICSDEAGGAIVTWCDYRSGSKKELYVQRINSSGNVIWDDNGTAICTENNYESLDMDPQICSDGTGGAIITWVDDRNADGDTDIYAQRVNASGDVQWTINGKAFCTAVYSQLSPQICSDGAGGAIITWEDYRVSGVFKNIYAQRINPNGVRLWKNNGESICMATNGQAEPQIISDGAGGAIITWEDYRTGSGSNIYAQLINSTGDVQWTTDGVAICTASGSQAHPELCSDGAGGAIITWHDDRGSDLDIYSQKVNSSGDIQWTTNGEAVCTATNSQLWPQICIDGAEGAIITWQDRRAGSGNDNIYAQQLNSTGDVQWNVNGIAICTASGIQSSPQICSDGISGAIITWYDYRGTDIDIYAQRINSTGEIQWTTNGNVICGANGSQERPQICSDRAGGAIITWWDYRAGGGNIDVYAQRIKNDIPSSDHPGSILTSASGSETINWTLSDDCGGGQYRILANDTYGNFYIWVNWTSWTNKTPLNVPINRSAPGSYNYTIEYVDFHGHYGVPNTVIVTIIDEIPTSNHPGSITASISGSETVDWILYDDFAGGKYRVLANDTYGNFYIWVNWNPWTHNTSLDIPVNRTVLGVFNYTIEYYDDHDQFGIADTVIVEVVDISGPIIIINSPNITNDLFGLKAPLFNVRIIDFSEISLMWYTLDGGLINESFSSNNSINQYLWNGHGNGTVTIEFYAKDIFGNIGFAEVMVRKDIIEPNITIYSPQIDEIYGITSPTFNISYVEPHLESMWYSLDNGLTNITLTELSGTIDKVEWDRKGNGTVTITFYANDTLGNIGFSKVTIRKDIICPNITIHSPHFNEIWGSNAPNFDISIFEPHIDSVWYTIDNGLKIITLEGFAGTIDQFEWDKKGLGMVNLIFYANDTLGNLGFQTVSIEKYYEYWLLDPIIIDELGNGNYTWAEAVMKGWCSGSGLWNDPYIIEKIKVNGYASSSCIEIRNSEEYFIIRNGMFHNSGGGNYDAGIKLDHVINGKLIGNNCSNNNGNGILLEACQNIIIEEDTVNNNGINGIFLLNSNNNSIENNNNTINYNENNGINLLWSNNNTIIGNRINYNSIGIFLSESNYNVITENDLRYNNKSYEEINCIGNLFDSNILDVSQDKGLNFEMIILITVVAVIATISLTGAVVWKKRIRITEEEREEKIKRKKSRIKNLIQKKLINVNDLLKDNNYGSALKHLIKIREKAQFYQLDDLLSKVEEKISYSKKLELAFIKSVKKTIINLGKKFSRLRLNEIVERSSIKDKTLIENIIQKMIQNKEIVAEYFSSTKTFVFQQGPVLKSKFKEIEQFNVFLSYSTKDSEYFQLPEVVKSLEQYPEIYKVLYWEADSKANIVEFMEKTLKETNVFVLFCSENSMNSEAVKGEWQAAYQMNKEGLMKIIPVYEEQAHIPRLLWHLLNVKYSRKKFNIFIENLYHEMIR